MADNLPSRKIDRAALEKIIQRATELQAGELDTGESLTEAELLKLGAEVGIDGRYLRQALYEQGSGATAETGLLVRWFGPLRVGAGRVVSGTKADIEASIGHWMTEGEALTVKRRLPDRVVWEKQKGFMAEMKRGFGVGGKNYHLAKALDVTVVVTQLESGFCHVELVADISQLRQGAVGASVGSSAVMLVVGGGTIALTTVAVVPLAVVASLGFVLVAASGAAPVLAGRVQRTKAGKMQLALEQVLDRLEHGEIKPRHASLPPSPFFGVAEEIRKAITGSIESARHQQRRLPPNT